MTKKAIFIGPAYPYRGGIAAFNENLASSFQNNGWTCKIFTFTQQYPNFLFPGKNQLSTDDSAPNLNIKRAIYSTNPLNWLKITKEIVALEPDLMVVQYWMPFMAPAFGTILRGVKKGYDKVFNVTVVHNFKPHESLIGEKQLGRFIASRTDLMVALSNNVASDIRNAVPDKPVSQLFHPIYDHYGKKISQKEAQEKLGLDPGYKYLLFFGLVRSYKGLDLLLDALALLKSDTSYRLIIAGEFYESEKKYLKQIEDLDVSDQVILKNEYILNDAVPHYFCAADVVVLPYRRATQSGVVPIAIHFEKPIIATDVGDFGNMIKDKQIGLIASPDPESIAENIDRFLDGQNFELDQFDSVKQSLSWQSFFNNFTTEIEKNGFGHQGTD